MADTQEKKIPVIKIEGSKDYENTEGTAVSEGKEDNQYLLALQRLQADIDNMRKRNEREKQDLADFVRGNLIQELLPILDDFERFLSSASSKEELEQGARLIYSNLIKVFEKYGLKSFDDVGKDFDPNIHEAVGVRRVSPERTGKIIETWQKGYWLKEKLLRPAKVVVGQSEEEEQGNR